MEDVVSKLEENFESKIVWLTTPKRKERIKVFVPANGLSFWKVSYERAGDIPELNGVFTGRKEAIKAVVNWLRETKETKEVLHDIWFGDKETPELQTKKRVTRRAPKHIADNG